MITLKMSSPCPVSAFAGFIAVNETNPDIRSNDKTRVDAAMTFLVMLFK